MESPCRQGNTTYGSTRKGYLTKRVTYLLIEYAISLKQCYINRNRCNIFRHFEVHYWLEVEENIYAFYFCNQQICFYEENSGSFYISQNLLFLITLTANAL